ncbi:hypothetical protein EMCRGX_G006864 [Ephydatia muelleri]
MADDEDKEIEDEVEEDEMGEIEDEDITIDGKENSNALQDDITTYKWQLEALTAVGKSIAGCHLTKGCHGNSEQLAAACTAFEALQAAAKTRRQVLEDARLQVSL